MFLQLIISNLIVSFQLFQKFIITKAGKLDMFKQTHFEAKLKAMKFQETLHQKCVSFKL